MIAKFKSYYYKHTTAAKRRIKRLKLISGRGWLKSIIYD
jgi:hypothetical protein